MSARLRASAGRVAAISRHNVRLLLDDPGPILILFVLPLFVVAFLRPTYEVALQQLGYEGASGAEQAVPGMTVMFAFIWLGFLAYAFFVEEHWRTWDRLRASGATTGEIVAGKMLPAFGLVVTQIAVLLTFGLLLFDVDFHGSVLALAVLAVALAACVVALTLLLVSLLGNMHRVTALGALTGVVLAALGGALTPPETSPDVARTLAPLSPSYWAVEGFRGVTLRGDGLAEVAGDALALAAFAAVAITIAVLRLGRERSLAR